MLLMLAAFLFGVGATCNPAVTETENHSGMLKHFECGIEITIGVIEQQIVIIPLTPLESRISYATD